MDERTAEQLAAIVGGEAWQSGGEIWLVTVNQNDGSLVVFSGDAICEYESNEAFDDARASNTILLNIPETHDLYVIVDLKGNIVYQDNAMERGWRYEEDALHEARALESRGDANRITTETTYDTVAIPAVGYGNSDKVAALPPRKKTVTLRYRRSHLPGKSCVVSSSLRAARLRRRASPPDSLNHVSADSSRTTRFPSL